MTYTRAGFRDAIRSRLGWGTTDTFVGDTQLNAWINDSLSELHALLASSYAVGEWGIATASLTVTGGVPAYTIAADFGRLVRVSLYKDLRAYPIQRYDVVSAVRDMQPTPWTESNVTYQVFGDAGTGWFIYFDPFPPASATYTVGVDYIKAAPTLANDAAASWLGNDEYVVLDVASKCAIAEESDPGAFLGQKNALEQRIKLLATPIDTKTHRVTDERGREEAQQYGLDWWSR